MKALSVLAGLLALLLFMPATSTFGNNAAAGDGIIVVLSPSTVCMASRGGSVSAHTNIPASTVIAESVRLEGLVPTGVGIDSLGHLVAKFDLDELKAIVAPPAATLTFTGTFVDGTTFAAEDTIAVRE